MAALWYDLDSLVNSPDSYTASGGGRGTIKPKADFNAGDDVEAIEGLGTKEEKKKALIDILTCRSSAQREEICKDDRIKTLVEDLKGDTHCHFEDLLVALVTPPATYDSHEVTRAMKGAGTKDSVLIEIFVSRSNKQIEALSDAYLEENKTKLICDLKEVSGEYAEVLLFLAEGKRDEGTAVDKEKAREDAKILYNAREEKWTDKSKFTDILCHRSIPQLRQTLVEYKNIYGKTLESIEGEMSSELEELLVAIVKCVKNVPAYLAECLHKSMKDEATLNRIMVSRSEVDLLDIRAEFKKLYGHSLHSDIQSALSGEHRDCVTAICGGDD